MATEVHDVPAMDKPQQQGYGTSVNEQRGKTRSDVEYIKRDVSEIKTEMREMKTETRNEFRELRSSMHAMLEKLHDRQERDFRILFGVLIATTLGLTGVLAKAFGWL